MVGVIGKGSFGTVSRIRRKADGRIMVWKELNYGNMREKEKQLVVSEVRYGPHIGHTIFTKLSHGRGVKGQVLSLPTATIRS